MIEEKRSLVISTFTGHFKSILTYFLIFFSFLLTVYNLWHRKFVHLRAISDLN